MNLGRQIKSLRLLKSVTQEELAEYLSVSTQAISKWENDIATPDIQLLPELSAFFGVTIDELCDVADEAYLERIENMLQCKRILTKVDYENVEEFRKEKVQNNNL